jgi:hypothetical protein
MSLHSQAVRTPDIAAAIRPLRLIFWGGLLCVFDFNFSHTVNGSGFKFDVFNDAVGCALIAWGVIALAPLRVHDRYANVMTFVKVVSILAVFDAIRDHWIVRTPPIFDFLSNLFGLITLVAIVAFCIAMRWFCEQARLVEAAASWRTTTILFIAIYFIPLGLLYIAGTIAIAANKSFYFNPGPIGLILVPIFFVPLIHLFISTSRMKRAAVRQSNQASPSV